MTGMRADRTGLFIQPATGDDLDRLLAIEGASFSSPWTRKMFEAELAGNPFGALLTAKRGQTGAEQEAIGYICFWVVFEELRLMNLAVDQFARRQRIGTALVQEALRHGACRGAVRAFLEVRASNTAAVGLYQRLGFRIIGTRTRYYSNPTEDALLMEHPRVSAVEETHQTFTVSSCATQQEGGSMLTENRIVEKLRESNPEFRALEESHHRLDAELAELQKRHVLTPQEELAKKQMQKEKLAKKDRMAELMRQYREHDARQGQAAATERFGT
jgi:ribosomal-protein-alanine N-acetyltransferase